MAGYRHSLAIASDESSSVPLPAAASPALSLAAHSLPIAVSMSLTRGGRSQASPDAIQATRPPANYGSDRTFRVFMATWVAMI